VHLVAQRLFDLSDDLATLSERDGAFPLPHGRGDEFASGSAGSPDSRDRAPMTKAREIYIPDLHIDTLKVKSRNFQ
jgi:error-prone DNA polymerase